ncbi:MAG: nucleotidyltransferase domain-containing protein, partial [Clostridia bacterium]|nr:nucleotidyltransferase domain-containing protein [Clostridia bacterium]
TACDDAEGFYRRHWLLTDSLEVYCDAKGLRYFGSKKTLRLIERTDSVAFRIYSAALKVFERERLEEWVEYFKGVLG